MKIESFPGPLLCRQAQPLFFSTSIIIFNFIARYMALCSPRVMKAQRDDKLGESEDWKVPL